MAKIVGGFCLPHDPLITGQAEAAPPEQAARVMAAFEAVRQGVERLRADTVIVIGDDHYAMFGPGCQPSILIGIGDLEGPIEPWLRIDRRHVANHPALAEHIMSFGFDNGFDWAVAKTLSLDHSTMVPIHLSVPAEARVIPVYIACGMTPLIRGKRCRELGRMIGDAVAAWPGDERVVILGTGGISHWVGMADMGKVNEEYDRKILDCVVNGDAESMIAMPDDYVVNEAGNGALEIRNFLCMMGALPGMRGELIAYERGPEWVTGLGFAEVRGNA